MEDGNYRQEYDWDNLGRLLARRTVYKAQGVTNELDYRYGEYGDLVSEQGSDGYTMQYLWDDADNLTALLIAPPKGVGAAQQVKIEFDAVGRVTRSYLVSGSNVVAEATLSRDEKGRLKQFSYSGYGTSVTPLPTVGYSYDARDLVTNIVDYSKNSFAALGYDPRGYLNSETWSQLSDGTQLYQDQLGYDDAGNRVWRLLNGNLTTYSYNAAYQLTGEVALSLVRVPTAWIHASADSTNSPARECEPSLANGQQAPDSDAPGSGWRSDTNAAAHWLQFDLTNTEPLLISAVGVSVPTARGGLAAFQLEVAATAGGPFELVPLYQILQGYRVSTDTAGTHQHTVRVTFLSPQLAAAVRVLVPQGGTALNPLTLAQLPDVVINQVALYETVTQVITRSYDPDGRLTNDGTFTYAYNVQGCLTGVVGPGVNKTWTITPDGLRGSETDNLAGQTRYFANDGANPYLEFTLSSSGAVQPLLRHFNAPGADNHVGFFEYTNGGAQFRWVLTQGPGSVRQVLDSQGNVLDDRLYTAWGEDLVTPAVSSANPFGFAGARQDPETGLYYNRARMYDPQVGRFTASDPLALAAGANPYLYADNDSVSGRDPSGLEQEKEEEEWVGYKLANGFLGLVSNGRLQLDTDAVDRKMNKVVDGGAALVSEPLREVTDVAHLGGDAAFGGDESGTTELTSLLGRRIQSGMAKGESGFAAGCAGLKLVGGMYVKTVGRAVLAEATGGTSEIVIGGVEMGVGVTRMYTAKTAEELEDASDSVSGGAFAVLGGGAARVPEAGAPEAGLRAVTAEESTVADEASAFASRGESAGASADAGDLAENLVEPVPGGMSVFSEPNLARKAALTMEPKEGWFNVAIHGRRAGKGFAIKLGGKTVLVSPKQLLRAMIKGGWKGESIRLWSCNAGAGRAAAAWKLHDLTGVPVMAPTDLLWPSETSAVYRIGPQGAGTWELFHRHLLGQ